MGFVRTAAETEAITTLLASPRFGPGCQVAVEFRTDPTAYAALLPPPLIPATVPVAIASVGRWHSNVVGPYAGGSLGLLARLGDIEAVFPVAMWMDSEPAVRFGTEVFGEPKKLAAAHLDRSGDIVTATLSRHEVDLVSIRARLDRNVTTGTHLRRTFNVRARIAADGRGLATDAELTLTDFTTRTTEHRTGTADLALTSGPQDPAGDLPVQEVLRATWQEHTMSATCRAVATIPAATYWPWHLGRLDDPRLLPRAPNAGDDR